MIESTIFIGAVIAAITEAIRLSTDKVHGAITIGVAALTGLVVALVDTGIGVANISLAQGVMIGLAAAGTVAVAKRVG